VHKTVLAGCIEIGTTKCVSGVAIDLAGSGGTITAKDIAMTIGCAAGKAAQKQGPTGGDLCGVSVVVDADARDAAKALSASSFTEGKSIQFGELPSSTRVVANESVQVLQGRGTQTIVKPIDPPATSDPAVTVAPATNKSLNLDASAAAKKKKKKKPKRKVSLRVTTVQALVAGGQRTTVKAPLTKRGKAIRTLYRKLKKKTMPATVTVRFRVNGSGIVTVKQKVKLRIR
jgi:hypothetical protein